MMYLISGYQKKNSLETCVFCGGVINEFKIYKYAFKRHFNTDRKER